MVIRITSCNATGLRKDVYHFKYQASCGVGTFVLKSEHGTVPGYRCTPLPKSTDRMLALANPDQTTYPATPDAPAYIFPTAQIHYADPMGPLE